MNLFFASLSLFASLSINAQASTATLTTAVPLSKTIVVVLSEKPKAEFEEKITTLFEEQLKKCQKTCEIKNISPYTADGLFKPEDAPKAIDSAPEHGQFLFVDWNVKLEEKTKKVQESLKNLVQKGFLVVGTAGAAKVGESVLPLHRTVLGTVPDVIIIGELVSRENLPKASYFGPEMLTAVRPPKASGEDGQGAYLFASRLAAKWSDRAPNEWVPHFKATKEKSRRIWPGMEDFFR